MPTRRKPAQGVGSAIIRHRFNRSKGYENSDVSRLHTLDAEEKGRGLLSVVDRSDLDEMMHTAELAERDFAAERGMAQIVIRSDASLGFSGLKADEMEALQKAEEELQSANLKVPRRPSWNSSMTAEELDDQERKSFLEWRRGLAGLEENERLILTPFEKNLDIWRQLWRVLERSDVVVMVVDSRNPLFYRCPDLEEYVRELNPNKRTIFLLNKADLLPLSARAKWADYFTEQQIGFFFWSAKEASESIEEEPAVEAAGRAEDSAPDSLRVLNRAELLEKLFEEAKIAHENKRAEQTDEERAVNRPVTVGFVGYPNVGKSSTINALAGEKKTGVTSTPGKTKHFQTLLLREDFVLCDCPGLVFPSFSSSRSEMVAAGVLPIDRLTDQRGPIDVVAKRVPRSVLESTYGIVLPKPAAHEAQNRPPTAAEVLRAYARSRGHVVASGLPDETRASRQILKDYLSGKLPDFQLPPGGTVEGVEGASEDDDREEWEECEEGEALGVNDESERSGKSSSAQEQAVVDEFEDLRLSEAARLGKEKKQPMRAAHKLHKRSTRKKDRTWRVGHGGKDDDDGMPVVRGVQQALSHGAAGKAMVKPEDRAKIGLTA